MQGCSLAESRDGHGRVPVQKGCGRGQIRSRKTCIHRLWSVILHLVPSCEGEGSTLQAKVNETRQTWLARSFQMQYIPAAQCNVIENSPVIEGRHALSAHVGIVRVGGLTGCDRSEITPRPATHITTRTHLPLRDVQCTTFVAFHGSEPIQLHTLHIPIASDHW